MIGSIIKLLTESIVGNIISLISVFITIATGVIAAFRYFHSMKNFSWRKVKKGIFFLKNMVEQIQPNVIISDRKSVV